MVPISLLPLLGGPLMTSLGWRGLKPRWMKHKCTASFRHWPGDLRKFTKRKALWVMGNQRASSSSFILLGNSEGVGPHLRGGSVIHPTASLGKSLFLSAVGTDSLLPVNALSVPVHSHSGTLCCLMKGEVQSQLKGSARSSLKSRKAPEGSEMKCATSWMKYYPNGQLVCYFRSLGFWWSRASHTQHFSWGLLLEKPTKGGIF